MENETVVLTPGTELSTSVVTKKHHDLKQMFIKKVRALLTQENLEIVSYGVTSEWQDVETIKLKLDDKRQLEIVIRATK